MAESPRVILIAEDDLDHAELIRECLRESAPGADVRHVYDGEAALTYLQRRGEYEEQERSPRPDLILLDLRMPKIDGLDVLKAVKSDDDLLSIPIVVLSTSDAETDIRRAFRCYANSYLVKPLNFANFSGLIEDLANYWLKRNASPDRDLGF